MCALMSLILWLMDYIPVVWLLICGVRSIEVLSPFLRGIVGLCAWVTSLLQMGEWGPESAGLVVVDSSLCRDAVHTPVELDSGQSVRLGL